MEEEIESEKDQSNNEIDEKEDLVIEEKKIAKKKKRGPTLAELIPLNQVKLFF